MSNYIQLQEVHVLMDEFLFEFYLHNIENDLHYLKKHAYWQDIQFQNKF